MSRFQDVETKTPTILTTSQLLTTGVDAPTCKNIVLARVVSSMTEFKQIIGRGTRVRDDYGKLWFNILDYTGSATRLFADPDFDGDPVRITEEEDQRRRRNVTAITETSPKPEAGPPAEERTRDHRTADRRARASSISTAARSRSRPIWSTSSTRTASSSGWSGTPTTPPKRPHALPDRRRSLRERWADPDQRAEIIASA